MENWVKQSFKQNLQRALFHFILSFIIAKEKSEVRLIFLQQTTLFLSYSFQSYLLIISFGAYSSLLFLSPKIKDSTNLCLPSFQKILVFILSSNCFFLLLLFNQSNFFKSTKLTIYQIFGLSVLPRTLLCLSQKCVLSFLPYVSFTNICYFDSSNSFTDVCVHKLIKLYTLYMSIQCTPIIPQ